MLKFSSWYFTSTSEYNLSETSNFCQLIFFEKHEAHTRGERHARRSTDLSVAATRAESPSPRPDWGLRYCFSG